MRMKRIQIGMMLSALLLLMACTEKEAVLPEAGTLDFRIETRAEGGEGTQKVRLYVADRRPELDIFINPLCLYCPPEWQMDLTAPDASGKTSYSLSNLLAQWYKFAFVCVPQEVVYTANGNDGFSLDFTQQWLDYSPVLSQPDQTDVKDRSIYRKVMDRWLKKETSLTENVTLERITGQLIVDMGILADQFEKEVTMVEVLLKNVPKGVYVHEQSADEIRMVEEKDDYTYTGAVNAENHYIVRANLLPMALEECKVQVTFSDNSSAVYPLINNAESASEQTVQIKANTRTTLYFHGMEDNEFEVRYAGFNEGDASIGIDNDAWDGWEESKQAFVVEYDVQNVLTASSRAGATDSRVQSLTYLLYQQMDETDFYLVRKREVPGIANALWPLSRENGMTWAQREALKDTLAVGEKYKAVFVANAAGDGLLKNVNVMPENEDLSVTSKYADTRLVLPETVDETNMFYGSVKDIDGTAASHDTPTHCGVILQRAVTRTDITCGEQPEVQTLVNNEDVWEYIENQYKSAVSDLETLVSDAWNGFDQVKALSLDGKTVEETLEERMTSDFSSNPLWSCFDATSTKATYQTDTYANEMSWDRVSSNSLPVVAKTAAKTTEGIFSFYSFGANAADDTQNVITQVQMGTTLLETNLITNQGINEHYLITCNPFDTFNNATADTKGLELTLNIWEMFVEVKTDDIKNMINTALLTTGQTVESFVITLNYPDMSKQATWNTGWTIVKK